MKDHSIVITTINPPTPGVIEICRKAKEQDWPVILIGDNKTPKNFAVDGGTYFSVESQNLLNFSIAKALPLNTYSRKMIGYLLAVSQFNCQYIRETDDDNYPYPNFFQKFELIENIRKPICKNSWINPYIFFTSERIWPRGFPLEEVFDSFESDQTINVTSDINSDHIIQSLADGDPDVDAIFRLIFKNKNQIKFSQLSPLVIPPESIAPFNSQVTTWPRNLLPLMYLPVTCNFRMTDIWRSFICQKIISDSNSRLIFSGPMVFQDRNEHEIIKDFENEIPGYLGYKKFISTLNSIEFLKSNTSMSERLLIVYQALIAQNFFEEIEYKYLQNWLNDIDFIGN